MDNSKIESFLELLESFLIQAREITTNQTIEDNTEMDAKLEKMTKIKTWTLSLHDLADLPLDKRRIFIGCSVSIYRRPFSKHAYGFEAKLRRKGYNVYSSSTTVTELKKKFIERLKTAEIRQTTMKNPTSFTRFTMYYFENFRIRTITAKTYQNDLNRCKKHLFPHFGDIPISKITPLSCQKLLDNLDADGKSKTATEVFSLMSIIFKAAINHDIISKNPLRMVFHKKTEATHGKALTKDEENLLLETTANTEYQLMFAIALYTGMRPNEYETAKREGNFIVCRNSKRKKGKIEYKKIPITPKLNPYIKDVSDLVFYTPEILREKFRAILPNHKLYDLRTTFYTRCVECDIAEIARKLFVGHSLGELANAYTDVSDEYLIKEGNKLNY